MTQQAYTPKQNFLDVIRWDNPKKVYQSGAVAMTTYFGASPIDSRPSSDTAQWQDFWGVTWTDCDGEVFPTGPAIDSLDEIEQLNVPDFPALDKEGKVRRFVENMDRDEKLFGVMHPYFLYEKALNILGGEEFMMQLALSPDKMHEFLDKVLEAELKVASLFAEFKPDCVTTMDDYGMQDRLAVSPEMWREFFKPRLKKLIDFYKENVGEHVIFEHHSCGHVMPIAEDFIEVGLNILNPIQSTANDLAILRSVTSKRLVLAGGICGQRVLPTGSPEDVRQEVFNKMDMLWENGGYVPFAEKNIGVPTENMEAMFQAIEDWERENLGG
jgi:uroporphyrinogen decarboxylase